MAKKMKTGKDGKQYPAKSGAKLTKYTSQDGNMGEVINAWNASKKGFLSLKAYKLTEKGAKAIAKLKEYDKSYSPETSNGNERWYYQVEFKQTGEVAKKYYKGIAIFKRSSQKLYISRLGMVASCKNDVFCQISGGK
ncbi:hypothetical protein [Labilibacter marinus]|uniref:hypothetical protein n=1 Tax=Labilibacter marinus TaxID=1477105 RepID=UPI000830098F|nr:hypothetical protein [Labilibacter marinus]